MQIVLVFLYRIWNMAFARVLRRVASVDHVHEVR